MATPEQPTEQRAKLCKGLLGMSGMGALMAAGGFAATLTPLMALGVFVFLACGFLYLVVKP